MKKSKRNSNFELLRIVSMFLIVIWHTLVHGKVLSVTTGSTRLLIDFFMSFFIVHASSLIILTGYFQCEKETANSKKAFRLLCTAWFYRVLFLIVFLIIGTVSLSDHIKIFEEIIPLDFHNYWFINNYIVLYLLSPYLNILSKNATEKQFKIFIIILFVSLSIIPTITNQNVISNDGYGIFHFILLYYLGSYFRKYPLRNNYHFKNYSKKAIRNIVISCFIISGILHFIFYYFGAVLTTYNNDLLSYFGNIIQSAFLKYSSPLVIITTISYFLTFETFNIQSKLINNLAKPILGVYLVHDNKLVRNYIYDLFNLTSIAQLGILKVMLKVFETAIIIFIVSYLIEVLRMVLVKVIGIVHHKISRNKNRTTT